MMKQLSKLYTDEQNKRISAALGNKPEPADLAPRFLIALNERNLQKVGDDLSEGLRDVINQSIKALKKWLAALDVALDAIDAARAADAAIADAAINALASDAALDAIDALDSIDESLNAARAAYWSALVAYYARTTDDPLDRAYESQSANWSAEIGNREDELNWQVNKLIELIGGE